MTGRVAKLDLRNNGLRGRLPSCIGQLADLRFLYLGGNELTGELPRALGELRNLRRLWLAGNDGLCGWLPRAVARLSDLIQPARRADRAARPTRLTPNRVRFELRIGNGALEPHRHVRFALRVRVL